MTELQGLSRQPLLQQLQRQPSIALPPSPSKYQAAEPMARQLSLPDGEGFAALAAQTAAAAGTQASGRNAKRQRTAAAKAPKKQPAAPKQPAKQRSAEEEEEKRQERLRKNRATAAASRSAALQRSFLLPACRSPPLVCWPFLPLTPLLAPHAPPCRQRRLDRIMSLEARVEELEGENGLLKVLLAEHQVGEWLANSLRGSRRVSPPSGKSLESWIQEHDSMLPSLQRQPSCLPLPSPADPAAA